MVAMNEDVEINDLQYDIYIKNWTSEGVEFQVVFQNPLAVS